LGNYKALIVTETNLEKNLGNYEALILTETEP
jgi:hypothetical protein